MINFSYEEMECLNGLFEENNGIINDQDSLVSQIVDTMLNTENDELIEIQKTTIKKIHELSTDQFKKLINSFPLNMISQKLESYI